MSFASPIAARSRLPIGALVRTLATGSLAALALLLVVRRLAGAFVVPLSATAATEFALLTAWLVLVAEWNSPHGIVRGEYLPRVAATLASLALPTVSTAAVLGKFGWVPLVLLVPYVLRRRGEPGPQAVPSRVRQQLTRTLEADGRDVCRGSARAEFAAGQRTASVHLAFCPPFATTPEIAATAADGTAKVAQALPYAARIEIKLPQPAAAARGVAVSFTAASPAS